VDNISAQDFDRMVQAMAMVKPTVVVNCIGIIKQRAAVKDALTSIMINALFPHRLARVCQMSGTRLIHMSTDCVFSGRKGNYLESDVADAEDLYGRTKLLGEVSYDGCLTLRTSIIGRELETAYGLLEWFLAQQGQSVGGYKWAIFSGLTTQVLAEIMAQIITDHQNMQGIWHVAAEPINKLDLLSLIKQVYGLNIRIEPDEKVVIDRSLNADKFRQATGYVPPAWPEMIEQMSQDPTPYSEFRRSQC
jgi:dTDP-4-dehydrorhamnose reductase